ncbi:hypothetical protein POSPLADRAFT_1153969 [Postia placenta MAD-698-R-SB12]|uniref:Retrotransposon gag domain-containing protein n=1 Tax=Postia placenta MAD-698-R-SB12 TaxID=670580 RepID=A0A1X6MP49_9APHY|nr:hypothetical protein POSPLADRAFT_1153969 [Postia placenta MAD-698-R-SB12]OSX58184.1 hypothetical protein POSPLADRAFT_1153969 [Postia placenta MAD-698-R-SB12]
MPTRPRGPYAHLPFLPPSNVAACQGQVHAFDSQDLIDVYIPDGPETIIYRCEQQPCPNRTPRSIPEDYPRYKAIRRAQHPLGPRSTLASRSASRHSRPVSPTSRLPQTVAESSQARGDLPPDPAPEPEPEEGEGEEGVSESESEDSVGSASPTAFAPASAIPDVRNPPAELPPAPSPLTPPRGRSSTRSSRNSTSGGPPQPPPPPQRPPSPPTPIMSSPAAAPDKETLKLLLPLRYDGKTVIECNRFLSQLRIYWLVNTSLTTIELKVQVAMSLLDGDARAWATPYFAQLASVQMGVQGVTTPFRNEAAFTAAFKARFGNLDDAAAAQVELAKLCADKSVREKCTAAEFSALFKGPADRSGYGDLELRDKYLSGIPSRVYRKIELETFTTW